jgi:hypothetical protein
MYRLNAVFQMLSDLLNEAFLRLAGENSNNPTQRLHQTGTRNVSSMQQPNMKPRQACTAAKRVWAEIVRERRTPVDGRTILDPGHGCTLNQVVLMRRAGKTMRLSLAGGISPERTSDTVSDQVCVCRGPLHPTATPSGQVRWTRVRSRLGSAARLNVSCHVESLTVVRL